MSDDKAELHALPWTGERYLPGVHGNVELEHLHRYLFAVQLISGKQVLDIASGEGYGSAILARFAAHVTGVDISSEAISHAKEKYKAGNLEFRQGSCADIPLSDACIDIVVSFETIEHHCEHEAMMLEIKRVLKPGGLLLISCPDKLEYSDKPGYQNEYHVKELYRNEFEELLENNFSNHTIFGQRAVYGSLILQESNACLSETFRLEANDMAATAGLSNAVYLIAIATEGELPSVKVGLLDQDLLGINEITERDAWIVKLNDTVDSLIIDRDSQKAGIGLLQGFLEKLGQERDEQISQLNRVVAARDALIGNLAQSVESLVIDRDSQKAGIGLLQGSLEKLAQERDEQMSQLNRVVAARDALIGNLGHTAESLMIDQDLRKARLEESLSAFTQISRERDEQSTRCAQAVAELEQSILSLSTDNEALGQELSNVYRSRSWRFTSPMRKFIDFVKRVHGLLFRHRDRYEKLHLPTYGTPASTQNLIAAPLTGNTQLSVSDSSSRYRILLVSYYCPTRSHAGGLRILDIYSLIRQQLPDVQIDLLTHHRPTIDGSIDDNYQIFDNVYLSPAEGLAPGTLASLCGGSIPHYDLVDLQFHQSAYHLDAFRQVASKVIFTPMECQAKALFLDIATKFKSGKGVGLKRIASLINLAAEEIGFCRKADEVVCVSRTDASFLRAVSGTRRVRGIDTGISKFEFAEALEPGFLPRSVKLKKLKIIYIAYFGSETNVIALKWFLENVHPIIKEKVPGYVLTVVGRGDLSGFERFRETSVELVGEVPAIAPYISEARVGIAPALGGSGLRGKVNQYAVLGVPCVVSPIALKGLAYRDGKNVCVAETPNDFADGCIRLLTDLDLNERIATAARQLCMDCYSWQSKWPQIQAVYGIKDAA
jgi:SAM-dependent methyltransferase/glycosyltransferase involved in cell wall biosynthesis